MKLRGRTEAPQGAEGAQSLSARGARGARGAQPQARHGPLQRWLEGGVLKCTQHRIHSGLVPATLCFEPSQDV